MNTGYTAPRVQTLEGKSKVHGPRKYGQCNCLASVAVHTVVFIVGKSSRGQNFEMKSYFKKVQI